MKKNTEKLKAYLKLAIQNSPDDFVFENIKPLLRSALAIVEKVERKRENREIQNQQATINNNIIATPGFWSVTYNIVTKAYAFTAGENPNPIVNITGAGLDAAIIMNTANGVAYNKQSVTFGGGDGAFAQAGTNLTWGGPFPEDQL